MFWKRGQDDIKEEKLIGGWGPVYANFASELKDFVGGYSAINLVLQQTIAYTKEGEDPQVEVDKLAPHYYISSETIQPDLTAYELAKILNLYISVPEFVLQNVDETDAIRRHFKKVEYPEDLKVIDENH